MTQQQLVIEWIKEHGYIIPAKMSGEIYYGIMFGSETSKRCRELRRQGKLLSLKNGKFEEFRMKPEEPKVRVLDTRQQALL